METTQTTRVTTENIMQTTPMDRAYIDEHDVVQRYIRRTLTESELAQFEIHMLSNPSIIEEIEQQRMLNQIFREELPKANREAARAMSRNVLYRFRHAIPAAACLVLAMYVGLEIGNRSSRDSQAVPVLDTVVLQDLRGATEAFNVQVPASVVDDAAELTLPLKIDVGPQLESAVTYNVFVRSSDDETTVAQQDNQQASTDGWLEVSVTLPAVVPAAYQVEVVEFPRGDSRSYSFSLR